MGHGKESVRKLMLHRMIGGAKQLIASACTSGYEWLLLYQRTLLTEPAT